jgi:hypothetical protein
MVKKSTTSNLDFVSEFYGQDNQAWLPFTALFKPTRN